MEPGGVWCYATRAALPAPEGGFGQAARGVLRVMAGSNGDKPVGPADLEAIAARCEAATAGPWDVLDDPLVDTAWVNAATPEDDKPIALFDYRSGPDNKVNAAFVAAARSDVPLLLDLVNSLSRRIEELVEANNREVAARIEANRRLQEALARFGAAPDRPGETE